MSKPMRAKMKIGTVTIHEYGEGIKFDAIPGGSPEDNSFASATPSGEIQLFISNKELHGCFKPGQKFHVDFTPCD